MPSDSKKKREQKKKEAAKKRDVKKPTAVSDGDAAARLSDGDAADTVNGDETETCNGASERQTTAREGKIFVCNSAILYIFGAVTSLFSLFLWSLHYYY